MIRLVIVDDEAPARRKIRHLLKSEQDVEIVGEAQDGAEAVALILETRPDLVFLDIHMPEKDGFAVIEEVGLDAVPTLGLIRIKLRHRLTIQ